MKMKIFNMDCLKMITKKKRIYFKTIVLSLTHMTATPFYWKKTHKFLCEQKKVWWYINDKFFEEAKETVFDIENSGVFKIKALGEEGEEEIVEIFVEEE